MARQIKVACLLGDGFEDTEFRAPYERMRREGFDVVIIGARKGAELRGKRGKEQVRADAGIDEVDPADFDLLFIPGGNSPDQLRADPRFVEFVKRHPGRPRSGRRQRARRAGGDRSQPDHQPPAGRRAAIHRRDRAVHARRPRRGGDLAPERVTSEPRCRKNRLQNFRAFNCCAYLPLGCVTHRPF